jgi:glutamyl-tRNA synthetase
MTDTLTAPIRTRIAPSPTGFLHLGTARTALYSWAYARHHGGEFVLRIEDTDVARSNVDSVDQILAAMHWLGLQADEGPIYQMQRLQRYQAVAAELVAAGLAYPCYCTPDELDAMRDAQKARGEKTGYDGRWRPAPGKKLPKVPEGVAPVIRFCNPQEGVVNWNDLVKGPISVSNREIDDLIILRPDGVPTYNFAVVVDDWDMRISHVFRGDEHVNNTPWQINIFRALGAPLPLFGHLPVILGDDGLKLSKRRGAVSVTAYEEAGYLPEGMLNYLARLGWSHGDEEIFSREQFVAWFDGSHLSKSPAQWDAAKLSWVNAQHMKLADDARLAALAHTHLLHSGLSSDAEAISPAMCALFKERSATVVELADGLRMFFGPVPPPSDEVVALLTPEVRAALAMVSQEFSGLAVWDKASIAAAIKSAITFHKLKMPQIAVPLRWLVCGRPQTPSIDAVLALFPQAAVVDRLRNF